MIFWNYYNCFKWGVVAKSKIWLFEKNIRLDNICVFFFECACLFDEVFWVFFVNYLKYSSSIVRLFLVVLVFFFSFSTQLKSNLLNLLIWWRRWNLQTKHFDHFRYEIFVFHLFLSCCKLMMVVWINLHYVVNSWWWCACLPIVDHAVNEFLCLICDKWIFFVKIGGAEEMCVGWLVMSDADSII